ncbi:hypothetical protein [Streptomyces sp. NBC_01445]|uniref:hypothetical protein n=1 Tax=Streptomyces sp. NBC_01445 TaxID=2903869 RepID=UPI002DDC7E56|nr:hypothetical protein [Streptomyces sp. NBC_01445]WSE10187.1 hypothetical protein OG574_46905 [Streptomyces sp. NBC_01445]
MGATQRVFVGLDVEWALVCATPANGALVRVWIEEAGIAAACDLSQELRELVAYLAARRDAAFSDRWLITLLDRAAGEGQQAQLAARVIVQAMVPGMVRLTQSLLTPRRDFDDVAQLVVGCLYVVARTFPLHRRAKVAANVMLETLHHATRELGADEAREVRLDVLWDAAASDDDVADRVAQDLLIERGQAQQVADTAELDGTEGELVALLAWGVDHGSLPLQQARSVVSVIREEAERTGAATPAARKRRSRALRWLRPVAAECVRAA